MPIRSFASPLLAAGAALVLSGCVVAPIGPPPRVLVAPSHGVYVQPGAVYVPPPHVVPQRAWGHRYGYGHGHGHGHGHGWGGRHPGYGWR
jgi:hypothetical protein